MFHYATELTNATRANYAPSEPVRFSEAHGCDDFNTENRRTEKRSPPLLGGLRI